MLNRNHKTVWLWCLCLVLAGCLWPAAHAVPAQVGTKTAPLPLPRDAAGKLTPVSDNANAIDDATEQKIANLLKNLKDRQNIDFAVVTVPTTGEQTAADYSLALMEGWGVGARGTPGLLLLVAINDRKYFTQVSRDLQGDLSDGVTGQIQRDNLVPLLRQNRYSEAIYNTTQAFVGEMARKRNFSVEGLDQRYTRQTSQQQPPRTAPRNTEGSKLTIGKICLCMGILLIVLIVLVIISRKSGGGGGGGRRSGWGGGGFGGIIPIPIPTNWGGGNDSSSSDWGSSDWGGFSGGGGDADGGGAGGDW